MFRATDDEKQQQNSMTNFNFLHQQINYPNLSLESSMMMDASVLMIKDEGFEPIVEETQVETFTNNQSQFNQNSNSFRIATTSSASNMDGLNDVVLTPRSSHGSNRSSRSNSISSKRVATHGYLESPNEPNEDSTLGGLITPRWNVDGEDDIEIDYASGSSLGENELPLVEPQVHFEPIEDRSEFDLGIISSCKEDWRKFFELRSFLADIPILNKIISFVYYPNLDNIMNSNGTKTNDIANMLKSILKLRLVNKKWKQSIDNPTGVLYHYLLEYSSIQKSLSLKNLEVAHSEFSFFSVPGIYMVGIGQIIGKTSLIPLEYSTKAYTKMEQDYGPAAANTMLALGAGITIASGSFALFMLSGAFYLLPIAAGGYVLDKAIEIGLDYTNKKNAEREIIQGVEEKEKALNSFRTKMRKITKFEKIEIVKHEPIEEQGDDASLSGKWFSYTRWKNNHSVYYVIQVTMVIDQSTHTYKIKKRYSQFEKLFKRMCSIKKTDHIIHNGEALEFPTKEILGTIFGWRSDEIIETRKNWFNKILQELVMELEVYKEDEAIMVFLTDSDDQ